MDVGQLAYADSVDPIVTAGMAGAPLYMRLVGRPRLSGMRSSHRRGWRGVCTLLRQSPSRGGLLKCRSRIKLARSMST